MNCSRHLSRSFLPGLLAAATLLSSGCRDEIVPLTRPERPNPNGAREISVYELQSDDVAPGTLVNLREVVVTAIDNFGGTKGAIFVADPKGGPFSGTYVYLRSAEAAGIAVGDLVDVEGGEKVEFALSGDRGDKSGRTLTQVAAPSGGKIVVTVVGEGTVPEPPTLLPWELAADEAEAEAWEGVLIRFENVRVSSVRSNEIADRARFHLTGPYEASSDLTGFEEVEAGQCYSSIVGLGYYFFSYKIVPRSPEDLVLATGETDPCLPPESGQELCTDEVDNDRNGLANCEERACVDTSDACNGAPSLVQFGDFQEREWVRLTNVLVTARTANGKQIWVMDPNQPAGPGNGIVVFNGKNPFDDSIQPGVTLDVVGNIAEFDFKDDSEDSLTQITRPAVTNVVAEGEPVEEVVTGLSLEQATAEEFEAVLVTLEGLKVSSVGEKNRFRVTADGLDVQIDPDVFAFPDVAVDQCLNITGLMNYNSFINEPSLVARSVEVVDAALCAD